MKGLDDVQQIFLVRVLLGLEVRADEVLMEVMEAVTEPWSESECVENRVEEASVAEVCQAGHARAVGPALSPCHTVHEGPAEICPDTIRSCSELQKTRQYDFSQCSAVPPSRLAPVWTRLC